MLQPDFLEQKAASHSKNVWRPHVPCSDSAHGSTCNKTNAMGSGRHGSLGARSIRLSDFLSACCCQPRRIEQRPTRTRLLRTLQAALVSASCLLDAPLAAETYTWSEGPTTTDYSRLAMPASVPATVVRSFLDVYCMEVPLPEQIESVREGMLNNNSLSYYRVVYRFNIAAHIVTSMVPVGRTQSEEFDIQLKREQNNAETVGRGTEPSRYTVSTSQSAWGPVVDMRIVNIQPNTPDGPFPLSRVLLADSKGPPHTISLHKLFARGANRFEIALIGAPLTPDVPGVQLAMEETMLRLAEAYVASLQKCTDAATSPLRGLPP